MASQTAARFMNQLPSVNWALCVNQKMEESEQKAKQKLAPVYQTYDELLKDLSQSIAVGKEISKVLKTKGINTETMSKARAEFAKLSTTPSTKSYQEHLGNYLDRYEEIRAQFPQNQSLHACSDVVESLFGKYKAHASDNFFVGVSSLSLEISLLTLSPEKLKTIIPVALKTTRMSALQNWKTSDQSMQKRLNE